MSENKEIRKEATDEIGVAMFDQKGTGFRRNKIATKFVPRTIVYPVIVYYNGAPSEEIRTFVRAQEYCSEKKWEEALAIEKKFPKTNARYVEGLKERGLPVSYRESANPLKITLLELGKKL